MKLKELLQDIRIIDLYDSEDLEITGLAYSSKKVEPGHVFVAIKGRQADGHDYLSEALSRGAAAVVSERSKPADLDLS